MKRTTTIEWTTITTNPSSWPPINSLFVIEVSKNHSDIAHRVGEYYFDFIFLKHHSYFSDYTGKKWTSVPLAPLEFNEIP